MTSPTFGPPARQRIDQQRLRQLRLDRRLSARHIAKETGIEPMNYMRLENADNPNLSTLTVAALLRLADYLRIPAGHLFTRPETPPQSTPVDPESTPDADARILGALLHSLEGKANKTGLADSLDWTMERLLSASTELDTRLEGVGMTLFDADGRLWIRALDDEHSHAETQFRQHPSATRTQRLLTPTRARMIAAASAVDGYKPSKGRESERIDLAALLRAGLIRPEQNTYFATDDVLYSINPLLSTPPA